MAWRQEALHLKFQAQVTDAPLLQGEQLGVGDESVCLPPAHARVGLDQALDTAVLAGLLTRYRDLAASGLAANLYRHTATAKDARRYR